MHRYKGRQDVYRKSCFVHTENQSKFSADHFPFQRNLDWIFGFDAYVCVCVFFFFLSQVVLNKAISKTQKVNFFTPAQLANIASLYKWNGLVDIITDDNVSHAFCFSWVCC